jgi:hypothetical protein
VRGDGAASVGVRPLPAEAVYLPFQPGPYRMAMDLITVPEHAWLEVDTRYPSEMATRRELLDQRRHDVFAAVPGSEVARGEALELVAGALAAHYPQWFSRAGTMLHNRLTGESWDLAAPPIDPLEVAGRLVQEDLCVIDIRSDVPRLAAAVLCFPSRWRLSEKLGGPLAEVHGPVPLYADRLARPVDRFMRHLKADRIACRLNWSVLDDPALFQPDGKWRTEGGEGITPANAGDRLYLRVERQTLRRLPTSGAVLFGIRVHVYRLSRIVDPTVALDLASAVRALPPAIVHYKSLGPVRDALLGWLTSMSEMRGG